jgi:branched-chain amino acid aminotransferase
VPITPTKKIWMDGKFVDWDDATIHILNPTLHYGWGVFEGIRAYNTDRGPAVFRLTEHIERLFRSAKIYLMEPEFTVEQMVAATKETVRINEIDSCYIRPLFYLGYGEIVSSWQRIGPNVIPPEGKGTGQYINSSLAKVAALKAGYDEAILLTAAGTIAEGTGENIFVVYGKKLVTPPIVDGVLAGLTRDAVMTIARDEGYEVVESPLVRSNLYLADEAFFTGTAAEMVPLVEVDDRPIGKGVPGPVTKQLLELFRGAVRGELDRYKTWNEFVNE